MLGVPRSNPPAKLPFLSSAAEEVTSDFSRKKERKNHAGFLTPGKVPENGNVAAAANPPEAAELRANHVQLLNVTSVQTHGQGQSSLQGA